MDLEKERISLSLKATQIRPVAGVRRHPRGRPARLRPDHQARALRRVRPGGRRHRGPRAHLGDGRAPRRDRPSRSSPPARSCGSRSSRSTPQRRRISLSIKQAARGWRGLRGVPRGLRRPRLRRRGQLHRHHDYSDLEFTPETEAQAAWADYAQEAARPRRGRAGRRRRGAPRRRPTRRAPSRGAASSPRRRAAEASRRPTQPIRTRRPRATASRAVSAGVRLRPRRRIGDGEVAGHLVAGRDLPQLGHLLARSAPRRSGSACGSGSPTAG